MTNCLAPLLLIHLTQPTIPRASLWPETSRSGWWLNCIVIFASPAINVLITFNAQIVSLCDCWAPGVRLPIRYQWHSLGMEQNGDGCLGGQAGQTYIVVVMMDR